MCHTLSQALRIEPYEQNAVPVFMELTSQLREMNSTQVSSERCDRAVSGDAKC